MLSDEVVEFAAVAKDTRQGYGEEQAQAYRELAAQISAAQRYALSREAAFLIHSVAQMNAPQVLAALKICRMPFPLMWVEMAFRDRQDYFATIGYTVDPYERSLPPSRLGYLIQQTDEAGQIIDVTLAWKHKHATGPSIGGLSMSINMTERPCIFDAQGRGEKPFLGDPKHANQWREIESRIIPELCRFMLPTWHLVGNNEVETERLMKDALYDLKAEWRFVVGLLLVLNSRNVVAPSEKQEFVKLNKARARNGKPPMLSYRTLNLSLSHVQRNRMGKPGITDLLKHLVSGHWKVRRTGIFWWSPHVRGTRGEIVNRTRMVKA